MKFKHLSFILSTFLFSCFSYGSSHFSALQPIHFHGDGQDGVFLLGPRRIVLEGDGSSMVLAENRTHRRDPFNHFKHYTGGWNISEKHYFTSVSFTAAPLLFIAVIWFLAFGVFICLYHFCFRKQKQRYGYSRTAYALSLIFLILFTIAAIIGCVFLYTGQGKLHSSSSNTLKFVVKQADNTVKELKNVSDNLSAAKQVGVDQVSLPRNVQNNIDNIGIQINASATSLETQTEKNSHHIQKALNDMRHSLIIISAVMLLVAFLGLLFSVLGMKVPVYILAIMGWILVAGTFILCGVFLVLHNMVADTCVAMEEWVQQPTAHTALDDILPCVDKVTAQQTLFESKDVTFQLVGVVNQIITNVSNRNFVFFPNNTNFYNQSGPLVPILCNPFNPDKTNRQCLPDEVKFGNAVEVWRSYVCEVSKVGICVTQGRLTPNMYNQMTSTVNLSSTIYQQGPFLVGVQDCTFVRDTFHEITGDHCPDLRRYSKWIFVGLMIVSTAVMLSLVFWVVYARERRHRLYTISIVASASAQHDLSGPKST